MIFFAADQQLEYLQSWLHIRAIVVCVRVCAWRAMEHREYYVTGEQPIDPSMMLRQSVLVVPRDIPDRSEEGQVGRREGKLRDRTERSMFSRLDSCPNNWSRKIVP